MDKYLIDTHVLLWLAQEPANIPPLSKFILESENNIFLSHVSIWEIAIKIRTGKLDMEFELADFINFSLQNYRLNLLPISLPHIYNTQKLILHHRDPFDRLLIAQSLVEDIPLISSDEIFDMYNVKRIWK